MQTFLWLVQKVKTILN
ncbi:MAG: hypothetical protein AB7D41_04785 [Arcobacter sp.]